MSTNPRRALKEQPRPQLRVIRGRGPRRSAMLPAAVVLVVAIFAVAALQAYLGQEGFHLSNLERQVREAEENHALLRTNLAELSSPARLQHAAEQMGMTRSGDPIFLPEPSALPEPGSEAPDAYASKRLLSGSP